MITIGLVIVGIVVWIVEVKVKKPFPIFALLLIGVGVLVPFFITINLPAEEPRFLAKRAHVMDVRYENSSTQNGRLIGYYAYEYPTTDGTIRSGHVPVSQSSVRVDVNAKRETLDIYDTYWSNRLWFPFDFPSGKHYELTVNSKVS